MISREYAPTFIAHRFHDVYEQLALTIGYTHHSESPLPWEDVSEIEKRLMERVFTRLIAQKVIVAGPAWHDHLDDCAVSVNEQSEEEAP